MLAVTYNVVLLGGAVALAMIAGFTGLSLTNGLSRLPAKTRKSAIAQAATVLGGGVWATHFVAMLALQLPVEVVYDPVYTLASALIAILVTGAALLVPHFWGRSRAQLLLAGAIMGLGVVAMHYVGMFGMRGCQPVFSPAGYGLSTVLSIAICVGALHVAYRRRSVPSLLAGGAIYGLAILVMHFSAMSQTGFLPLDRVEPTTRMVANDVLAMLVLVVAFLICGVCLLTTVTLRTPDETAQDEARQSEPVTEATLPDAPATLARLPYEQDGRTYFAPIEDIVAVQAEGHYSRLHRVTGTAFCPQPIARLAKELGSGPFLRTHRSYLVNLNYVQGFERRKDQGVCLFAPEIGVEPVPVSRANLAATKQALGL
ncbi:MAG: MHYT domain-containing protein [Pseudomonadota bacterium]